MIMKASVAAFYSGDLSAILYRQQGSTLAVVRFHTCDGGIMGAADAG
jgi:hypothetical protein